MLLHIIYYICLKSMQEHIIQYRQHKVGIIKIAITQDL